MSKIIVTVTMKQSLIGLKLKTLYAFVHCQIVKKRYSSTHYVGSG